MKEKLFAPAGWAVKDESHIERRNDSGGSSIYQYPAGTGCEGKFCSQTWRGAGRVSDVFDTLAAAIDFADNLTNMHIALFNRTAANNILEEMRALQQKLIALGCTESISGYDTGHATGRASALADIRTALNAIDPEGERAA